MKNSLIIFEQYLNSLSELQGFPITMGVFETDKKINLWCVIKDNDDATETKLFTAEAKVNGSNINFGVLIETTVVEQSDQIKIPEQYQVIYDQSLFD